MIAQEFDLRVSFFVINDKNKEEVLKFKQELLKNVNSPFIEASLKELEASIPNETVKYDDRIPLLIFQRTTSDKQKEICKEDLALFRRRKLSAINQLNLNDIWRYYFHFKLNEIDKSNWYIMPEYFFRERITSKILVTSEKSNFYENRLLIFIFTKKLNYNLNEVC